MKLKELAIDGFGIHRNLHLGRLGDGLSIIYGENGAGKTTVREFIRGTLFGFESTNPLLNTPGGSAGRLGISQGGKEFQLNRDTQLNSPLNVRSLASIYGNDNLDSLQQLAGPVNQELFDTIFSFSFRETATNAIRLASVLQSQFGVSTDSASAGDHSEYLKWQRECVARREQLDSIQARIDAIRQEKANCLNRIESEQLTRRTRVADLEANISQMISRINELQTSALPDSLAQVEREMAQLRVFMENAQPPVTPVQRDKPLLDRYSSQYLQLDELDTQIRRWRNVQTDIQNQRVRLRDEMLVWNELTLDSDEHPYHTSRAILIALESKVDEAERNANLWSDAGGSRVDTSQMAKTLGQLCQMMREDLYGLCNELAQQYKFIRHKAAAAELKQLRRCYVEMGKNIDRLISRRETAIREIREFDPAGADAIARADLKFCQCAQHEGYLEARRRMVEPVTTMATDPFVYETAAPDHSKERAQLQALESRRSDLAAKLARYELERQQLENRLSELTIQRDGLSSDLGSTDLNLQVRAAESELENQIEKFNSLRQRIEMDSEHVPTTPHPLLERAGDLLVRITSGELSKAFLGQPFAGVESRLPAEIQVRDRFGKVLNLSAIEPYRQDQVYLCLALACKEQLESRSVETPTIIDDAFSRIPSDQVTAMLTILNEVASSGHQILALTQHRYLADRLPGLPLFELPPTIPSLNPAVDPERRSGVAPVVAPLPAPDWGTENFGLDGTFSASTPPRPYPLSKYPRTNFHTPGDDRMDPVTYPFPQTGPLHGNPAESAHGYRQDSVAARIDTPVSPVSPVSINEFGDRLGYVSAITETLPLGKVGFFDAQQLRSFMANGIETVGDLLAIESNRSNPFGFNIDQLERWQSQLWLLINVPGLRIHDARVLVACGITEPAQLETSHPQHLLERVSRFLATSEGRRFMGNRESISLDRINGWYRSLDATRSNWQQRKLDRQPEQATGTNAQHYSPELYREETLDSDLTRPVRTGSPRVQDGRARRETVPQQREARAIREPREARSPRMKTPTAERKIVPRLAPASSKTSAKNRSANTKSGARKKPAAATQSSLKFYLDLNDHIEAAPAIGPKTAERFEKIEVFTVSDFLKQTAESMAIKIKYKRISADVIRQWQQQARFVCRVPNLRGHDAQLLVACGIFEPEELATMQPQGLLDIIGPFSETKEGLKIIRNGKQPDLAEITNWISWAENTRSLQAA